MKALLPLALLLIGAAPADQPKRYLVSIVGIPLGPNESVESFSFSTWGVDVEAVCHVPGGWRITAGSGATPEGEISGRGTLGTTWLHESSPGQLKDFVLVTMFGAVQRADIHLPDGVIPATFNGKASISSLNAGREIHLTYKNIRLIPANHCLSDMTGR